MSIKNKMCCFIKDLKYRVVLQCFLLLVLQFVANAQGSNPVSSWDLGAPTLFMPQLSATPSTIVNADLVHESLFNGTLNISVPIHELSSNMLKVPISLNYNTGGIKVQEQASRVGLGWNLSAGGMITREIRGVADESFNIVPHGDDINSITVPPFTSGVFTQPLGALASYYDGFFANTDVGKNQALRFATEKSFDAEPDIYHFNFNGYSGKIVFDRFKTPHIISQQNIKIDVTFINGTSIDKWTLTTGDGVQYIFQTKELINYRSQAVFDYAPYYYYDNNNQRVTGWCLDKIISPSFNNTIDFTYTTADTVFFQSHFQVAYDPYVKTTTDGTVTFGTPYPNYFGGVYADGYTNYYVLNQRISQISSNNSVVHFNYSTEDRLDLPRDKYLSSIDILTPNGHCTPQLVKTFNMTYTYLQDGGCVSSTCKRLALTSVTESANGMSKPPHVFTYRTDFNLPDNNFTEYADYWGYYNEADTDDGTLGPRGSYTNPVYGYTITVQGTNKASDANSPDAVAMQANVLLSVTNPTGGVTSFTYEANSIYDNGSASNKIVGGLRIKQTKTYNGIDHSKDIIKNYQYTLDDGSNRSSGSIGKMPLYQYEKTVAYSNTTAYHYLINFADPIVEVQTTNGSHIAYSCVTVSEANKGKTVLKYTDFKDHPDVDTDLSVYSFVPYTIDGIATPQGPTTCYLPSTSMEMERGLLLSKSQYDNNGNLQRRTINTYNFNASTPITITGLRVNNTNFYEGYNSFTNSQCSQNLSDPFLCQQLTNQYIYEQGKRFDYDFTLVRKLGSLDLVRGYFGFYNTVSKWVNLTSTTEEVYDQNNSGNKVSTLTSYEYSTSNLQPYKITNTNSDGRQLVTMMMYPGDYNTENGTNTAGVFAANNNELVMEKVVYEVTTAGNINILSGQGNLYDVTTGLIQFQYSLENATSIPLSNFKFSNQLMGVLPSPGLTHELFQLDSRYVKRMTYDAYDVKDNLLQSHEEKGVPDVTLWGQNYAYPIAKVSNVPYNKVAYSSFECGAASVAPSPATLEGNLYQFGTIYPTTAVTGLNAFYGTVTVPSLPTDTYKISFWIKSIDNSVTFVDFNGTNINVEAGNVWQYIERIITFGGDFQLCTNCENVYDDSGNGIIDEFRLCPVGALMKTSVYQPLVGVSATSDTRNVLTTYQYDPLNRLKLVLDQDSNIRKRYTYNYKQ